MSLLFPSLLPAAGKVVMTPGAGAAASDHKWKRNVVDDRTTIVHSNLNRIWYPQVGSLR